MTESFLIEVPEDSVIIEPIHENLIKTSGFQVFPVPSTNVVNIISFNDQNFHVEIFDGNGKKVHSIMNGNSRYTLDVSNYSAGVYYALITIDGKAIENKKIIVSR